MHVVMVAKYPLPGTSTKGGVERVVEILRHGISRWAKVTLLVPNAQIELNHQDEAGVISYLAAPSAPDFLGYWSLTSRALYKRIEQLSPDVVHVQDLAGFAFSWPRRSDTSRPRLVFTVHGLLERDILSASAQDWLRKATAPMRAWLISAIEKRSRARYDRHVVINDFVIAALPDMKPMSWRSIPNPVDHVFLSTPASKRTSRSTFQLLQVGVVCTRKNVLGAIAIVRELISVGIDVQLNVLGPITDIAYFDRCRQAVRSMQLEDVVSFLGSATPTQVAEWMDQSDALLMTSRQETAPLVIAEAHCRGLPTAAPNAFGLPSMVEEGANGVLMDDPRPEIQAAQVLRLLERKLDREQIRRNAIERFGTDAVVKETLALYASALAAP